VKDQESSFPVDIIPPWFSMLIHHLGINKRPVGGRSSETVSPQLRDDDDDNHHHSIRWTRRVLSVGNMTHQRVTLLHKD
jgi:hypothetical protein